MSKILSWLAFLTCHIRKNKIGYCSDKIQLCLVGNKADLTDKREVQFEEAQKLADEWGIPFFETSAKTASEVAKSFNTLADKIMQVDPQIE